VAATASVHAERPALVVDGATTTYASLLESAAGLAHLLRSVGTGVGENAEPLCALYAKRSLWSYAGVLGILLAGRGYVPLNPGYPAQRTRRMLDASGVATLVADARSADSLGDVLEGTQRELTILLPETHTAPSWAEHDRRHRVLCAPDLPSGGSLPSAAAAGDAALAYLLFTSGTTGSPKGIGISHASVLAYVAAMGELYDVGPEDRCSQNFELTFDLSVHDLFVCWARGACLYVPSERAVMAPAAFVRDHELTCWFSTPSTAAVMQRMRMLEPGAFPSLRWSLFCGEALTWEIAEAWQAAAANSTLENLYGPTEATIAFTAYRYGSARPSDAADAVVPIGRPFARNLVAVVGERGEPLHGDAIGELVLAGPQLASGYWNDSERTRQAFVSFPELDPPGPWYRTGDLVSWSAGGELLYRGRRDDQIKIRGHRVELQEVEALARRACGSGSVVALGWPRTPSGADGIILFVSGAAAPDDVIRDSLRSSLPAYMQPSEIHRIENMPLNASGKTDRAALLEWRGRMP
jgi:amino acid adenylation domain-containing protein